MSSIEELERKLALLAKAGTLADVERKLALDANVARLVCQIPAVSAEELERKLELLAKAGTLADVERKLGFLSAFDASLLKLLRRIPAATHQELEEKIASLIPKEGRTAAIAEEKERSWRGYNSYLVNLARRIPAVSPAELEKKIALLISEIPCAASIPQEQGRWIPAVAPAEAEEKMASLMPEEALLRDGNSYPVRLARRMLFAPLRERIKKVKELMPGAAVAADTTGTQLERKPALPATSTPVPAASSSFEENLLRLLRRIPAKTSEELEQKIISLIAEKGRAASIAQGKERSRDFDSYLVNLARLIPALDPQELERKISSLIPVVTGPLAAEPESGILMPAMVTARTGADRHSGDPAAPSAPRRAADEAPLKSIPAEPFRTQPEHLAVFGPRCERVDKVELAAAARRVIGGALDLSFPRFIDWLRSEGYVFGGFEAGPPRFDERRAYLRYDVHPADLLPAYVLADLHERLGIVGSFQITWKLSRDEEDAEPYFVKLLEFDRRFVQFGLHAAPTATWYLYEKLGVDAAVDGLVDGDDFAGWLLDLHAAYCRDGDNAPALREIRQGTDDTLSRLAASFRATFGEWKSISGHGNFLTKGFNKVRVRHPELDVLEPYFYPEAYFAKWGLARFGFDYEITSFGSDALPFPRVLYESTPEEARRIEFRGRIAHGAGFVALLHPATWTCSRNASFFLAEEELASADTSDAAADEVQG
jgi:hypothetical protein